MSEQPVIEAELSVVRTGTTGAPQVVLVHGVLDRAAGMSRLARELAEHAEVVTYDRRGYGRSRHHAGPFDLAGNVADLVDVIAGRPSYLVGHSFGGNVVLSCAQRWPEVVLGVAVYETPLSWQPGWPGLSNHLDEGEPPEMAERLVKRIIGERAWDLLPESTRRDRHDEGRALVAELRDVRRGAPWDPDGIAGPVIVGCGERAAEHHRQASLWISQRIAGAHHVTLDDAGHGAHRTHAAAFARKLVLPLLAAN